MSTAAAIALGLAIFGVAAICVNYRLRLTSNEGAWAAVMIVSTALLGWAIYVLADA